MTIAEMIKKTRLDNHMTQEEYGNKFGVTRQTVSSWENEKSIPDLQLIITICNTYHLSLDTLLNEDPNYVNKIDMTQKIVRIFKRAVPILCAAACVYAVILGVWKINAAQKNEAFASSVTDSGFAFENGHYILHDGDTVYELPNQKLPFMEFEFNLQQITASYRNKDFSCNFLVNYDDPQYTFSIKYEIDKSITGTISNNGAIEYDSLSQDTAAILEEYKNNIESILHKMTGYYNAAYDL